MSIQCNSISCYRLREMSRNNLVSPFSSNCLFSSCRFSKSVDCGRSLKLSSLSFEVGFLGSLVYICMLGSTVDSMTDGARGLTKWRRVVSAVVTEETSVGSTSPGTDVFKLTYLEGNSWLWDVGGLNILVDPILVGNLDFGIPWLYDASKKFLKNFRLSDLPEIDCVLITQSLDDHCHLKTLIPFSKLFPKIKVIATPNAKSLLDPLFSNVTYLEPGETSEIEGRNGSVVRVKAPAGPVLGPPWQRPENGYLVIAPKEQLSLYYEPHCVYDKNFLNNIKADIVVTPVIKQMLPYFTLVSGQEDAIQLAKLLKAKYIVSMKNGDLESKGLLASIVQAEGTMQSFKDLLSKELPDAKLLEPTPGIPLEISSQTSLP